MKVMCILEDPREKRRASFHEEAVDSYQTVFGLLDTLNPIAEFC